MSQDALIILVPVVGAAVIGVLIALGIVSRQGRRTASRPTSSTHDPGAAIFLGGSASGSSGADCSPGDAGGAGCDGGGGGS